MTKSNNRKSSLNTLNLGRRGFKLLRINITIILPKALASEIVCRLQNPKATALHYRISAVVVGEA